MDLCKKKKAEVTNKSAKAAAALGALLAPSVQQEPLQKKNNNKSLFTEKGIISLLFIFPAVGGGPAVRARDGNAHAREMAPT